MKTKAAVMATALLTIGLISLAAFAEPGPRGQGGPAWGTPPQQQGFGPGYGGGQGYGPGRMQGMQGGRGMHGGRGMQGGQGMMPGGGQGFGRGGQMGRGFAQQGPMGPGFGRGMDRGNPAGLGRLLRQLDLTSEQQEQIRTLHEENQQAVQDARQAVEDARRALQEAVAGEASEEAIRQAATELGNRIGDQAVQMNQLHQSIRDVLTDEQIEQLETLKQQAQDRQEQMQQRLEERRQRLDFQDNPEDEPLLPGPVF